MSQPFNQNATQIDLIDAFIDRCHLLIQMGHARLSHSDLGTLDEVAITGMLRNAIREEFNSNQSDEWIWWYNVNEDDPVTVGGKLGRRRHRIDLTVSRGGPPPRDEFGFEAKRLRSIADLSEYLGSKGMMALVTGYYGTSDWAGMLGYVQERECADWSKEIKDRIIEKPGDFNAGDDPLFGELGDVRLADVFVSSHFCGSMFKKITHTLLLSH